MPPKGLQVRPSGFSSFLSDFVAKFGKTHLWMVINPLMVDWLSTQFTMEFFICQRDVTMLLLIVCCMFH